MVQLNKFQLAEPAAASLSPLCGCPPGAKTARP